MSDIDKIIEMVTGAKHIASWPPEDLERDFYNINDLRAVATAARAEGAENALEEFRETSSSKHRRGVYRRLAEVHDIVERKRARREFARELLSGIKQWRAEAENDYQVDALLGIEGVIRREAGDA